KCGSKMRRVLAEKCAARKGRFSASKCRCFS
nr:Balbiani ring 2 gene beta repeat C [Chironomus sp.]